MSNEVDLLDATRAPEFGIDSPKALKGKIIDAPPGARLQESTV
jgi:hypothetical protein